MTPKSTKVKYMMKGISVCLVVFLLLTAAGCGGSSRQAAVKDTIIIYDGTYSEMWLIHRIVKLLVEEHTGAKVEIRDQMAAPQGFDSLCRGDADLYNSYDGTVLTTFLHLDVTTIPEGVTTYDYANEQVFAEKDLRLLDKLGFQNTYVLAVTRPVYEKYGMETATDLAAAAPELIFGAEYDFFSEEGSSKFNPMSAFYGLKFKDARPMDHGLKYSAMESGNIDVTVTYSTDGLNKKADLKLLEDDRGYFPEYYDAILVRASLFDEIKDTAPNLEEVLNMLTGRIDVGKMLDMTYAVDVEGKNPDDVAKAFLQEQGLIE